MSVSGSDVDKPSPETKVEDSTSVTKQQDDVKTTNSAGKGEGSQDAAKEPATTTPPTPPKKNEILLPVVTSAAIKDDAFYVNAIQFVRACQVLMLFGRVVILGPPRSGKTYFARALLQYFKKKGYMPMFDMDMCYQCQDSVGMKGKGPKRIVLQEVGFDELRAPEEYLKTISCFFNHTQEIWQGREWTCLVVVTMLPHLMTDVGHKEHNPDTTVFSHPQIIIKMTQDPHRPELPFQPSVDTLLPFVRRVLMHPKRGNPFSCLLALTMLDKGFVYSPPRTNEVMERLGYGGSVGSFEVELMYRFLKDVLFHPNRGGFINRGAYDACGWGLISVGAAELLLRVCDAKFLVDYVRFHEDAQPAERTLVTWKSNPVQWTLTLDRVYELMANKGAGRELSQHPSLADPRVVEEFRQHCLQQEGRADQLTRSLDEEFKLPVLYWALWAPTPHLAQLCADVLEHAVLQDTDLTAAPLTSLLACVFLTPPGSGVLLSVKKIVPKLCRFHFKQDASSWQDADTINLTLPFLKSTDTQGKIDQLKTNAQSRLCYLNDPALSIPPSVVSLTVTEEGIKLTMSRDNWYLVLRLLTDTEPEEADLLGNTVLHIAANRGDEDVLRMVVRSGASLTAQNGKGLMPMQREARKKREAQPRPADDPRTPALLAAAEKGDLETVKVLLCQGISLYCQDSANNTLLHLACRQGHTETASLFVTLMLKLRVKLDLPNAERHSPLHAGCGSGHFLVAQLLLDHGADARMQDFQKRSPVHLACRQGFTDVAALLTDRGAEVNAEDKSGQTPLFLACHGGHADTAELLLQKQARVNHRNGPEEMTALHAACHAGHAEVASLLLRHRADLRVKDGSGRTPAALVRELGLQNQDPVFEQILGTSV